MRYEIAPFASLVHCGDRWFASDPSTGTAAEIEAHPLLMEALLVLAEAGPDARTERRWQEELVAHGLVQEHAEAAVASAIELAILVPEGTAAAWTGPFDQACLDPGHQVRGFLSMTDAMTFLDYATPEAHALDREMMAGYAETEPPPSPYLDHPGSERIALPALDPERLPTTGLARVGQLLFRCFGRIESIRLHDRFELVRKPVPSFGARHPFEAYLSAPSGWGALPRGTSHYLAEDHALEIIAPTAWPDSGETDHTGLELAITALPERYQWRYRHSLAYKEMYLDLGHVVEMLHLACAMLDLCPSPVEPGPRGAWDGIRETCVARFAVKNTQSLPGPDSA